MSRGLPTALDILFVGDVPPLLAGSAISPFQILESLAERGHSVRAVGPITPETRADGARTAGTARTTFRWFEMPRFTLVRDVPPATATLALEEAGLHAVITPLIAERRPDVLIVGHEYWGRYLAPINRQLGLPCVQLVRGNPGRGIILGTHDPRDTQVILSALRQADVVACVAEYMARGLRALGVPSARCIPNAVDVVRFAPTPPSPALRASLDIAPDALVAMHLSNLKPIKRVLDIADSAPAALAARPDLVYVIAGDGLQRTELEERCRDLGVAHRFRFTGWAPYADVPALINLADMVLMPSGGEGMSRVYLETQACGRTLIASDIDAAREIVTPLRTGLLFKTGSPADLAASTVRAAGNPELRASIGRHARAQIEVRHSLEAAVSAYERVLTDVATRRSAR